jgi:hypothetical protein
MLGLDLLRRWDVSGYLGCDSTHERWLVSDVGGRMELWIKEIGKSETGIGYCMHEIIITRGL